MAEAKCIHYFVIDRDNVGVCRYCGEVRDFRKLQERERRAFEGNPHKKRGRSKKGVL